MGKLDENTMGDDYRWRTTDSIVVLVGIALGCPLLLLPSIGRTRSVALGSFLVFVVFGAIGAVLCSTHRTARTQLLGDDPQRFWDDALLFGRVIVIAGFLFLFALGSVVVVVPVSAIEAHLGFSIVSPVSHLGFSIVPPVCGAFAVSRYRRNPRSLPSWLAVDDWTVWTDVELFGIVAFLTITYAISVIGPASLVHLVVLIAALCAGTSVVILRRRGLFPSGSRPRAST
jgi:hypothetical protein